MEQASSVCPQAPRPPSPGRGAVPLTVHGKVQKSSQRSSAEALSSILPAPPPRTRSHSRVPPTSTGFAAAVPGH